MNDRPLHLLKRSLARDLSIGIIVIAAVTAVAAIFLLYQGAERRADRDLAEMGDSYLRFLQETLRIPLWEMNDVAVMEIGLTFNQNVLVERLEIFDAWGRPLFATKGEPSADTVTRAGDVTYDGQVIGSVRLHLSLASHQEEMRGLVRLFALAGIAVLLAIGLATGMLLRVFLNRSFDAVNGLVQAYAAGNYDEPAPRIPYAEFGPVVEMLTRMGETIRRQMSELRAAEAKYRSIFENAAHGIIRTTADGRILNANLAAARIMGCDSVQDLLSRDGLLISGFYLDENLRKNLLETLRAAGSASVMAPFRNIQGEELWIEVHLHGIMDDAGNLVEIEGIFADVTERRAAERGLQASLAEKEVLLKEVHHRVKNNLQVVSSLLYLQSASIEDERMSEIFKESQGRVAAMAQVHEELYNAHDLSSVDLSVYAANLMGKVLMSFCGNSVEFVRETLPVRVSLDDAVPCALILHELVTNACKHAFAGRTGGRLRLRLCEEGGMVVMRLDDDGPGFPEGFDPELSESLGMLLVQRLSGQLQGGFVFGKSDLGGAFARIEFPLHADRHAPPP
ncbi:signal transduction histidine kinase [Alkalidesulfovibrio alkalitolerans DSM 16529]|jgi:PAS domain S-box-containing protein|uniref:Signal transduction histidine kinase n=1 Tax=Alkalidesulfovibrio alkalitolerans DSM 16529 TaxID=1121439 RepID=S7UKR6_9BACT|nr:histidine kinase dimerization/phosphoacceptor domain -containing protein [Alkalidesulfovibrio alkalitolerans]EPR32903.1 signal transduction histidine kinase [Alkalidesulfovibrio alkalitolerans DSM 16529]